MITFNTYLDQGVLTIRTEVTEEVKKFLKDHKGDKIRNSVWDNYKNAHNIKAETL